MRRSSLVGPLLLIVIGGLFLANNLRPELSVLALIGQYWPFVLIGWGLLRGLEVLASATRGRPVPLNGISGGEWGLVVFLSLVGAVSFTLSHTDQWWSRGPFRVRGVEIFGESYDYPVSAQSPTQGVKRLLVENLRGNARIVGADGTDIQVSGNKSVPALDKDEADRFDRQTPLEFERQGDLLVLRTNQHRVGGERRLSSDLEITVPRGLTIQCRGRYGDFDVSDVSGDVEVNSDNAGVRLQSVGGSVRIETRKSDILRLVGVKGTVDLQGRGQDLDLEDIGGQVSVNGSYTGSVQFRRLAKPVLFRSINTELRAQALPGEVRMEGGDLTGTDLVGPVVVSSRAKDIQLSRFTDSLDLTLDRGDIVLQPGHVPVARMEVRTRSGDIDLDLPEQAQFELRAATSRGEVDNDYGSPLTAESSEGRGSSLQGTVGQGPLLVLNTERGAITIRKGGEGRLPPLPPKPPLPPRTLERERN